ncbi:uncharacterized protein ycf45 isoform X7 [Actinidia eriantha]|uniref:uncharacterized protein ycf45 isoform X7 n=1 Tax=Actinidia eriantha TaxID=165200 RepID=UPI0025866E48|nr:uncharacterized protein ycf45 isoform X7 [Actinidia eriantha]
MTCCCCLVVVPGTGRERGAKPGSPSSLRCLHLQSYPFLLQLRHGRRCSLVTNNIRASFSSDNVEEDDDIHALLQILPHDLRDNLLYNSNKDELLEVILDLGRLPQARYLGESGRHYLRDAESSEFYRPGVGKTTVMREISRVLSDELQKRVVIIDTSNEIGGTGDVPHPAIGGARRMQVPEPFMQHRIMIEAVENHMPEVIIVDEISTEAEVHACRSIAERGVMLIGTAHGERLENIIKNPTISDLIGGVKTVTLGDLEARNRKCKKSILERKAPPTFPFLIEMRERYCWVTHRTERSVDMLLQGKKPLVEVRRRDSQHKVVIERWKKDD